MHSIFYDNILLSVFLVFDFSSAENIVNKTFRKDYTFFEETQSFYKFQTIHRTWQEAKNRCTLEGASLFYPLDKTEVDVLLDFWNKTQSYSWIYIGVSDLNSKGAYETYDGIPISNIYNTWAPGEPNDSHGNEDCVTLRRNKHIYDIECTRKGPFVCKKTLASVKWNNNCDIPDTSYLHNAIQGKCYKYHGRPENWTNAYSICNAEQSYLAIINSQEEADYLVTLTVNSVNPKITRTYLKNTIFLGFHYRDDDGWKTTKDILLEESGYNEWGPQQPDGEDKELCGGMSLDGKLNDLDCSHKAAFICEHDITMLETDETKLPIFSKSPISDSNITYVIPKG